MNKSFLLKFFIVAIIAGTIGQGFIFVARAEAVCPSLETLKLLTEAELREALTVCEKEAVALELNIETTGKEKASLNRDISLLNDKIQQAKIAIRVRTLTINNLADTIGVENKTINQLSSKIERERDSLAGLLRRTDEIDAYSLVEIALSDKPLSDILGDLDAFQYIEESVDNSLAEIDVTKKTTEEQKKVLEEKKNKEADLRYQQEIERKRTEANEAEKQRILKITKGKEVAYQKELEDKKKKASQIRTALFNLRDSAGIPFSKALEYATFASRSTNVRPALILAILTQESDLGKNVGSCILSSLETGDGVGKNTGTFFEKVMKAPRDTNPFENITKRLDRDWKVTPVSCPLAKEYSSSRGFGGGMGPSQFIPSTWELFNSRIANAAGVRENSADPWDPAHSFIATAIYLSDLGAVSGSYTSERNSACRYYSGRKCDNARPANIFYGNQVMNKAEEIQNNIDFLKGV
ncbi:MAG: hypothetical protein HY228_00830 [Candidatus Yonathbacteria bacterium]|nr:hypothetical protein [Candidatus Yonathbacteria bacterium]